MKLIFSSIDLVRVSELKGIIETAGIACFLGNEAATKLAGGVPLGETLAELWIEDDSRLDEALQIKQDWESPQADNGTPWTCPKCGEKLESQFTSCWKCGTKKP